MMVARFSWWNEAGKVLMSIKKFKSVKRIKHDSDSHKQVFISKQIDAC